MTQKYNKKQFLCEDGIRSSSMIHAKLYENGKAQVRVSDCNKTIVLWNEFSNNPTQQAEMFEKLDVLIENLTAFKEHLKTVQMAETENNLYVTHG